MRRTCHRSNRGNACSFLGDFYFDGVSAELVLVPLADVLDPCIGLEERVEQPKPNRIAAEGVLHVHPVFPHGATRRTVAKNVAAAKNSPANVRFIVFCWRCDRIKRSTREANEVYPVMTSMSTATIVAAITRY